MSQSEVERFVSDLKSDAALREDLKGSAAGVASVVAFAQARGYDIGADEARQYISAKMGRELSDDQLDAIAGGKGNVIQEIGGLINDLPDIAVTTKVEIATHVGLGTEVVAVVAIVVT
jgi:predicted ribosomally synthesized peptide with nif11-like leader